MEEGNTISGWNRAKPGGNISQLAERKQKQLLVRGIFAGLCVIVLGGLVLWFFAASSGPNESDKPSAPKAIKSVSPANTVRKSGDDRTEKMKRVRAEINEQVKEYIKKPATNNIEWVVPPLDPNDPDNAMRTQTMKEVGLLLAVEPGEQMPPYLFSFMVEDACAEDAAEHGYKHKADNGNASFLDNLKKWKITLKESDDERRMKLKEDLVTAQSDLLAGMDEGLSVNDSIKAAYEFRQRAYEMRKTIIDTFRELSEDDGEDHAITIKQIKDMNGRLAEEGIKAISIQEVLPDYEEPENIEGVNGYEQ